MKETPPAEPWLIEERPSAGVLLLRFNRPERRNALSTPLLSRVAEVLDAAASAADVRAVILTGNAKVFAAGADIDELAVAGADDPVESPRYCAWASIRGFPKPLLAAVEGWCLGAGAELMMCCDIVVSGEGARFGQPETNLGIIPGAGGTVVLPQLVGRALAMKMVLTGEPIKADEALDAGLIAEVVPAGEALDRTVALAETIAARAPLALAAAKASIREASSLSEADHIRSERKRFIALLGTKDKEEGIAAFHGKRPAVWRGQ
jgi:enoyl-CoA hydratase